MIVQEHASRFGQGNTNLQQICSKLKLVKGCLLLKWRLEQRFIVDILALSLSNPSIAASRQRGMTLTAALPNAILAVLTARLCVCISMCIRRNINDPHMATFDPHMMYARIYIQTKPP